MKAIADVCMTWDGEMQHECPYDICSKFIAATEAVEENTNHDGCDMEDDMEADRWGTGDMYGYRYDGIDVCTEYSYVYNIIFYMFAYSSIYLCIHQ